MTVQERDSQPASHRGAPIRGVHVCLKNMCAVCFPKSTGGDTDTDHLPKPGEGDLFSFIFNLSTTNYHFFFGLKQSDHSLLWIFEAIDTFFFSFKAQLLYAWEMNTLITIMRRQPRLLEDKCYGVV